MTGTQVTSPTPEILQKVKLFSVFSLEQLQQIISMGSVTPYEAHSNIIIEGELSWGLFLILKGTVGIFKTNKLTGESHDIVELKAGSFFGEMSLVDDSPRSASVRALTDVEVFSITKESFLTLLEASDELKFRFYQSCIKTLVVRLRELDDNYVISQYQLWQSALRREPK